ncbi:MAG: hypothetical protein FVQ83_06905 [Chloroflexi bacterium]|nr:hypothetical protein [Chloroflexota bacterium]
MPDELPYIPGQAPDLSGPLARYLPIMPQGVISAWLHANAVPGSWVIDPFGASPHLAIEAAQAGYRVLVAANNPITRFLIEMAAAPPTRDELQASLAELAATRRGDERLEPHILSLYSTHCDHCSREVYAEAFLWERDADRPYARIYTCPHCEHAGEFPANESDIEKALSHASGSLHRARALERIAPMNNPNRPYAEEAIDAYLPRAVYALFTLINKLEGISLNEERHRLLSTLLLSTCDHANTLWRHPGGRPRPRRLNIPTKFRENNIWFALEQAIDQWTQTRPPVELVNWPQIPGREGGISLFEGRLKNLVASLENLKFSAVITAFPRPNQAFWSLSALWAGWLWGPEALGTFIRVLRRKRYEWAWHTSALQNTLSHLAPHIPTDTPFFGLVTESEGNFDAAAIIAAEMAGFEVENIASRPKSGQTQILWRRADQKPAPQLTEDISILIQASVQKVLKRRGEPSTYLLVQASALQALANYDRLNVPGQTPNQIFTDVRSSLEFGLTFRSGFLRLGGTESTLETGHWWLQDESGIEKPLADRLEIALVNHLIQNPGLSYQQIDAAMCAYFPGLQTPGDQLLQSTLESYAKESNGVWYMREREAPNARRADIEEITGLLSTLGARLGFNVEADPPIRWKAANGEPVYRFYVIASAVLGEIVYTEDDAADSFIVLPGGRAGLVLYKHNRDPRLKLSIERGWRFLKFRHIRRMSENPAITPDSFKELIGLDPLTKDEHQIPLL